MERRRRATWVDRFMFALLGLFVIATLGNALVGGITLLDVNLLTRFAPWQALNGKDILATNICRGDTIDGVMPFIAQIRSRLLLGDFPGWSVTQVGGSPLAGSPNYGQFSPLSLPYYVLPLWLAPAFIKLGEFAVAIGGMTLFLRRLRLSYAAGILAGIVFASSGFMLAWTNWPQTRVAALIPALFWATERLIQRQRVVDSLPLAAVVASMLLGGFPAVTGMALYCAGLYFLVRIAMVHGPRWRTSLWATLYAGLGLILGAALTAFQLLPFARQLSTINLDYRAQTSGDHSSLSSLLTTMVPDAQGLCINGISSSRANPIENLAFLGVAAIVLGLVAITMHTRPAHRLQRGVVGFLGIAVAVVVILGWVGGPLLSLAQHFPVFSNNDVSRIRSMLGFLVAVLAGFGFERLMNVAGDRDDDPQYPDDRDPPAGDPDDPDDPHRPANGQGDQRDNAAAPVGEPGPEGQALGQSRFAFLPLRSVQLVGSVLVLAVTTIFALLVLSDAISEARVKHAIPQLKLSVVTPVILLVLCVALVLAVRFGPRWARYVAIVAIPLIAVGQSASAFRAAVPGSNPDNFYPVTSTHWFLKQNLGSDRYASSAWRMYPSTSAYYGLRTPTGHAFTPSAWTALLHAVDSGSSLTPTFSDFRAKAVNAGTAGQIPILDRMAVRYFVAADSDIPGTRTAPPASLRTAALASDQHAQCAPASGPLRAVTLNVARPLRGAGQAGATIHVILHTPRGDLTGARYVGKGLDSPTAVSIAIPGEDLTSGDPVTADIWASGARGAFVLAGTRTAVSCGVVLPIRDELKLVSSAGGAIVYQRLTSLSRIRWASTALVQTNPAARVAALKAGISHDAVLLSTAGPSASGRSAKVRVTADQSDRIAATVDAAGAGYLVVADSLQRPGWSAKVDGRPVALLPADNAMVTVHVSEGIHRVELSYAVPGQRTGALVTAGAFLLCLGIATLWWWRRRSVRVTAPAESTAGRSADIVDGPLASPRSGN